MIDFFELQELACVILGLDYNTILEENKEEEIDEGLDNKYGIDISQFEKIIRDILPLTYPIQSSLSHTYYHCLGVKDEGFWRAIIKQEYYE